MHSYPVRLVLVLRCTFIYHHSLCRLIVVALLSLCRCAGSFKHFLGAHVQKTYCKFSTYFWAFTKGPGQPAEHMRSLAKAFAQRVEVSIANTLNACVKLHRRRCENARMVKLNFIFTGSTSVTILPMRIKHLLHELPEKAHVILSSCAVSPEHLTARRLIALIAYASTPSLALRTLGNFSYLCWRLLAFCFQN